MILTKENLRAAASDKNGYTKAQLSILGLSEWKKGWLRSQIGREISDEDYKRLLSLRGKTKATSTH